jgi:quinolinate synthase
MFGEHVVARVERDYGDADITAHLEVPGEMFRLALAAQARGRGVVGSTSNILQHIQASVRARLEGEGEGPGREGPLRFILGTEAGMVTAIVRGVRQVLRDSSNQARAAETAVEIVFPVAGEAVATTGAPELPLVPGVRSGEGCGVAGGCATCPYMKMNTLDALLDLLTRLPEGRERLAPFEPRTYTERVAGQTIAALGSQPILHMRDFQRDGALPEALMHDVRTRVAASR